MIRYIPKTLDQPVCTREVCALSDDRRCDPRTIRNHIRSLIAAGLAEDKCLDGGARRYRAVAGTLIVNGISFEPMMARAEELVRKAAEIEAITAGEMRLRSSLSSLRRKLKRLLPEAQRFASTYEKLRRRIAHMTLNELLDAHTATADLLNEISAFLKPVENSGGQQKFSDRSENSDRQIYYKQNNQRFW